MVCAWICLSQVGREKGKKFNKYNTCLKMFCLLPSIQRGAPRGDRGEVCSYIILIWRSCFDFSRSSLALHRPHCVETTAECGGTCPRNEIWKPLSDFGVALACVIRRRLRALVPESAMRIMNQNGTITHVIQISQELDNTNSKTRNSESFCCGPMFWTCFLSIFYCRIGIQGMAGTASLRSTCVELDSII